MNGLESPGFSRGEDVNWANFTGGASAGVPLRTASVDFNALLPL